MTTEQAHAKATEELAPRHHEEIATLAAEIRASYVSGLRDSINSQQARLEEDRRALADIEAEQAQSAEVQAEG